MRYLILFLLLAATSYCAAQKTASKPTIERIEDPAPTKVKLLTDADDDLLPVKSTGSGSTRPRSGKSTVKDPATKAGNPATIRLKDVFQFDLVVGYSALIPGESLITSYFFLDSKQGHCGLDKGAVSSMANSPAEADGNSLDFLLHSYQGGQYYFMTSADKGKLVMTMNTGNTSMNVDMDAWLDGSSFEETFRLTGQKRKIGKNLSGSLYVSEEYIGKSPIDGSTLRIWMADPDFNTGFYAATYMGLGVISLPRAKKQRLITRIEGGGAVWEVSYLQRQRNQFSGAAYQPVNLAMADELKEARANLQKQVADNDAGEETDPVLKQLKQQQAATNQQMAGKVDVALQQMQQSADLSQWQQQMNQALGEMDIAGMQLNQLKQEQRELELQLRDARKENDKMAINTLNCQLQCNQRAQTLMISIDKRKKEIITKYPGEKNTEKRSALEAELYQQMIKQLSVPCNCD
jgi:septum formation inhibitor MinC